MNMIFPLITVLFLGAAACDKHDDDPRDPAHPRCGHLLPNTHLFDICVDNPFPTTLHPATDTGANTISCWINDTIAFRNWRPWLMGRPDAEARRYDEDSTTWHILGTYENFEEIDRRRITVGLLLQQPDTFWTTSGPLRISGFNLSSGAYNLDTTKYNNIDAHVRGQVISGSFNIWLRHQHDSTKTLHLTDGRFDVKWYWF